MNPLKLLLEHKVLSDSEAKAVSEKYNTPLNKFPKLLKSDPQVERIGAVPGQLVSISREDPTGKYTYYRYVIES